jgi:integrase
LSPFRNHSQDYEEIFLKVNYPCEPLKNGNAISSAYAIYSDKLAIKSGGFHGLRRALGRDMVAAEVPLPIVAQVFDHDDYDTTKRYISLETHHLKECAMDFGEIAPGGGLPNV